MVEKEKEKNVDSARFDVITDARNVVYSAYNETSSGLKIEGGERGLLEKWTTRSRLILVRSTMVLLRAMRLDAAADGDKTVLEAIAEGIQGESKELRKALYRRKL